MLDRRPSENQYPGSGKYSIADMAAWPWYGALVRGQIYDAAEFLQVNEYSGVLRWTNLIGKRLAIHRGRMVNFIMGDPAIQLHERHDAGDFDTRTQDKAGRGSGGKPGAVTCRAGRR